MYEHDNNVNINMYEHENSCYRTLCTRVPRACACPPGNTRVFLPGYPGTQCTGVPEYPSFSIGYPVPGRNSYWACWRPGKVVEN
eukprot:2104808-Rhodomonas_salina.1